MPSAQAFVAVGASVWLLEQASGIRAQTPLPTVDAGNDTKPFARCDYASPEGGAPFSIGLNLPGYQPGQQKCGFKCNALLREFNTAIMPNVFDAEFVSSDSAAGRGAFCKCTAHGGSRTIIKFHDYKDEHCQKTDCWRKYLVALNFNVEPRLQVGPETLQSSCSLCDDAEECADEVSLLHVDDLAREVLQPALAAAEAGAESGELEAGIAIMAEFRELMNAEGIILDDGTGSAEVGGWSRGSSRSRSGSAKALPAVAQLPELADKGPCDPLVGPFPRQCIVVPGPRGDEWIQQLAEQGCAGNQFVVHLNGGAAVAVTVPAVNTLVGEDVIVNAAPSAAAENLGRGVHAVLPFTENFRVRTRSGVVRIGIVDDLAWSEPALDYMVTGSSGSTWLPYTQGLALQPDGDVVKVVQLKPEKVKPNRLLGLRFIPAHSYTHKPKPPNLVQVNSLASSAYAELCKAFKVSYDGYSLGKKSYAPPSPMA